MKKIYITTVFTHCTAMWLSLVILAAWFGSRYGWLKQLDGFGPHQEPIILYSVYDAIVAWFDHVVFVIREDFAEAFKETIWRSVEDKIRVSYVFQSKEAYVPQKYEHLIPLREKPWWTAHAALVAKEVITQPFAVINADDFYGRDAFIKIADFLHTVTPTHMGMIWYILSNTLSPFWSINRWVCEVVDNTLTSITERLKIAADVTGKLYDQWWHEVDTHATVSMNFWWFHPSFFTYLERYFEQFLEQFLEQSQGQGEYFIPLVVDICLRDFALSCKVMMSSDKRCWVSYQEDKPFVQESIAALHDAGIYPAQLFT